MTGGAPRRGDGGAALRGHLAALFTMTVWGATFAASKVLLRDFSPTEILVARFALGLTALWLLRPRGWVWGTRADEARFAAVGFLGITLYFVLENTALVYSTASNVAVLVSVAPLFSALLARLGGERRPLRGDFLLGFAAAMIGIALLQAGTQRLRLNPLGDALALGGALVWALYNVVVRQLSVRGYSAYTITLKSFGYALLTAVPLMWADGWEPKLALWCRPVNLLNLAFLGLAASALCFFTWNVAVRGIGPVKSCVYLYFQPVVAAAFAVWTLRERFTGLTAAGMALITCGLLVSEGWLRRRRGL